MHDILEWAWVNSSHFSTRSFDLV